MQTWSTPLFRVAGIRLELHATFLLLLAYWAFQGWTVAGYPGATWMLALGLSVFVCVVLHELGHSLMARHYGIRVRRILLLPIGGMAQFESLPKNPFQELAITVAGPAVNWVLAALFYLWVGWPPLEVLAMIPRTYHELGQSLLLVNLGMGLFNLIPAFPMDGGRILRATLALKLPYLRATTLAVRIGKVTAAACALLALFNQQLLLAALFVFIFIVADAEFALTRQREALAGMRLGDLARKEFLVIGANEPGVAALRILEGRVPQDVLVIDNGRLGLLTPQRLCEASARALNGPARQLADWSMRRLQADRPAADLLLGGADRPPLCLVYSGDQFVGVLDPAEIEGAAARRNRMKAWTESDAERPV